jgi:hypothetical protein
MGKSILDYTQIPAIEGDGVMDTFWTKEQRREEKQEPSRPRPGDQLRQQSTFVKRKRKRP